MSVCLFLSYCLIADLRDKCLEDCFFHYTKKVDAYMHTRLYRNMYNKKYSRVGATRLGGNGIGGETTRVRGRIDQG